MAPDEINPAPERDSASSANALERSDAPALSAEEEAAIAAHLETEARRYKVPNQQFDEMVFRYTRDITQQVKDGRTDPVIGREQEVDDILTILLQRGRSNAVLLGEAGVGKTATFIKLARLIEFEELPLPRILKHARVIELEWSTMGAGTLSRSDFEGRLIPLLKGVAERNETRHHPKIIICLDELHTIMPNCLASSARGVSDILKPYLTMGSLQVVGATTRDEFSQYIKPDPALERRFQKVMLEEPDEAETIRILKGMKRVYEKHFELVITDELVTELVPLATKYMRKRQNPDKSLMTLDGACARALRALVPPGSTLDMQQVREAISAETGIDARAL